MAKQNPQEKSKFLFYSGPDDELEVEVFFQGETVWLTQKRMAELFEVEVPTINEHLKNIYDSEELNISGTIRKFLIVQEEGKREVERKVKFYNLDAIISVGYRVNSQRATRFRQWATKTLRNYMIKGFALDDERLKYGSHFGKDYFEELLERIREIRASERRFYLKVCDIFATASDYDKDSDQAREFFAKVQNKLHWAITGKTAAELIKQRADSERRNMGLTNWKGSPSQKILKSDTEIAKNYLQKDELASLRRIVNAFLDLAEDRAERRIVTTMADWSNFLDDFLELNDYEVLEDKGSVSHEQAVKHAAKQYQEFRVVQDQNFKADFEAEIKKLQQAKQEE